VGLDLYASAVNEVVGLRDLCCSVFRTIKLGFSAIEWARSWFNLTYEVKLKKIDEHRAGAVNFRLASKDVLNVLIKEFQYYHNLRFTFHRNIKHSLPDFLLAQKYCDGPKPKILHVSEDLLSVALNTRTLNTYSGKENLKRRVDQIVSSSLNLH
jgi:hypothetical protein